MREMDGFSWCRRGPSEFLVRQIDLIGRQRALDRRLRYPTARLLACLCCLGIAGCHLGLVLGPLARMALLRPRLDHRLGAGREPPAMSISMIGLDTAKSVFQVHGV